MLAGSLEVVDEYDLLLQESPSSPTNQYMNRVADIFLACASLHHLSGSPSDIFSDSAFQNVSTRSLHSSKSSACRALFGSSSSDSENEDEALAVPIEEPITQAYNPFDIFKESSLFTPITSLSHDSNSSTTDEDKESMSLFRPISKASNEDNASYTVLKPTPIKIVPKEEKTQSQIDSYFAARKKQAPAELTKKASTEVSFRPPSKSSDQKEEKTQTDSNSAAQKKQAPVQLTKKRVPRVVSYRPPSRSSYGCYSYSDEQTKSLEEAFLENQYCPAGRKEKLGAELKLDPKAVKIWLTNARRRMQYHKKKATD